MKIECEHCDGEGTIETDNNGPIVDCPICEGKGFYIRVVKEQEK